MSLKIENNGIWKAKERLKSNITLIFLMSFQSTANSFFVHESFSYAKITKNVYKGMRNAYILVKQTSVGFSELVNKLLLGR